MDIVSSWKSTTYDIKRVPGIDLAYGKSIWLTNEGNNILYVKSYILSLMPEILSDFLNL